MNTMREISVPMSKPDINEDDVNLVVSALRSGQLSIGPFVEKFEELALLVLEPAQRLGAVFVKSVVAARSGAIAGAVIAIALIHAAKPLSGGLHALYALLHPVDTALHAVHAPLPAIVRLAAPGTTISI